MRWLKRTLLYLTLFLLVILITCNVWIVKSTESKVFSNPEVVPSYKVALVLGTSSRSVGGGPNPFFQNRINTAAALYKLGKVKHFILSGDNRTAFYNEPYEMRKALISAGVPSSAITLDFAGLRTLDSIVRSKEIFGQDKFAIITQPFHSYRALFISKFYNIDAVAIVADEPGLERTFKVRLREYFARTKAVLDLYVFKTGPRHLGPKEMLNTSALK